MDIPLEELETEPELPASTRTCVRCRQERPGNDFYRNGGFRTTCNHCEASRRALTRRNQEFVFAFLCSNPCEHCGEDDPIVLEFHHNDPSRKKKTISSMIAFNSIKSLKKEIAKCSVLCANCHRRVTAMENDWYSASLDPADYRDPDFSVWNKFMVAANSFLVSFFSYPLIL